MPFKFSVPDKAKNITTSSVGSTGSYGLIKSNSNNVGHNYSSGTNVKTAFKTSQSVGFITEAQAVGSGVVMTPPMFFSPLHTPQNFQQASKRREVYQHLRFYYLNEPKFAAGVDFYSEFSLNNFKLECKNKKVLKYMEKVIKDIKLNHWLKYISFEYFLIGDVFPFVEIACPKCGSGDPNCNHSGGTIKRITVMNPDWIEVNQSVLAEEPVIVLVPDEELRGIVQKKQPQQIYKKLSKRLIELIMSGQPIKLSNRSISHIAHKASPYGIYGNALGRRLFTVLTYKTKLITANYIVAERMILPVRIIKVGDKDRPAGPEDIQDVVNQIAAVANDPSQTIVTHHAFDADWIGATGKIHNITQELEQIGKEILDGLMLNQAILNGDAQSYSSAQVGVEIMIKRLESWRNTLAEWVENHIFLPIAMMKGFIDEDASKEMGETEYFVPKLKFDELGLRDNSQHLQLMMQLHDKSLISTRRLLGEFKIPYDQMIEEIREEQINVMPGGAIQGGGAPGGPMGGDLGPPPMDMGGGMGGGPPPMPGGPDMGGGAPGGPPGGAPMGGGDMGAGAPSGDMGAAPAGATAGGLPANFIVGKRGKGNKTAQEQLKQPPPKMLRLTSLETRGLNIIRSLNLPHQIYAQYTVKMAGQNQPFLLDFALPDLGIDVEFDGEAWHSTAEAKQRDQQRDQKLANVGWRVIRFTEEATQQKPNDVKKVIYQQVIEAINAKKNKKRAFNLYEDFVKTASVEISEKENGCKKIMLENDLGVIYTLGE